MPARLSRQRFLAMVFAGDDLVRAGEIWLQKYDQETLIEVEEQPREGWSARRAG